MRVRAIIFVATLCALGPLAAGAQAEADNPDFVQILRRADSLVTFPVTDFSALYSFVQETPGQGTTTKEAMVFRRDHDSHG